MSERNPHAPEGALQMGDIKPGLEAIVIRGGRYYHDRVTFHSEPFLKRHEGYDLSNPHDLKKVTREDWMVMASSGGHAANTEISHIGEGGSDYVSEHFLSDMGFCSSEEFGWSMHYTVAADGYRPEDHE